MPTYLSQVQSQRSSMNVTRTRYRRRRHEHVVCFCKLMMFGSDNARVMTYLFWHRSRTDRQNYRSDHTVLCLERRAAGSLCTDIDGTEWPCCLCWNCWLCYTGRCTVAGRDAEDIADPTRWRSRHCHWTADDSHTTRLQVSLSLSLSLSLCLSRSDVVPNFLSSKIMLLIIRRL